MPENTTRWLKTVEGPINAEKYEALCEGLGIKASETVFIFPGNPIHHTAETTLYSIKEGEGLADVARQLGQKGYPALSLPTTGMENWKSDPALKKMVDEAIANLYKVLGAGYNLILPVKNHNPSKELFSKPLTLGKKRRKRIEPNFWDGIDAIPNPELAAYYIDKLSELGELCPAKLMDQTNPLEKAYLEGENALELQKIGRDSDWFKPIQVAVPNVSATRLKIPASYSKIPTETNTLLWNIRDILNDYTKGNSSVVRIFTGHWNRHHLREIAGIVSQIDLRSLASGADVIRELKQIKLTNKTGSLARRIQFIVEEEARVSECLSTVRSGLRR